VLVEAVHRVVDVLDQDGQRRRYLDGIGVVVLEVSRGHHLDLYPGFLLDLAQDGLHRVLVLLHVAAGRKPHVQLGVPVQQRRAVLHDERGGGEVSDERHAGYGATHVASWTLAIAFSATSKM
jgi:hypothetical protein